MQFYFLATIDGECVALALVSMYSHPDPLLLHSSHGAVLVCTYAGDESLLVVSAKSILSVIAMVPFKHSIGIPNSAYFVVEKLGLDVVSMGDVEPI